VSKVQKVSLCGVSDTVEESISLTGSVSFQDSLALRSLGIRETCSVLSRIGNLVLNRLKKKSSLYILKLGVKVRLASEVDQVGIF